MNRAGRVTVYPNRQPSQHVLSVGRDIHPRDAIQSSGFAKIALRSGDCGAFATRSVLFNGPLIAVSESLNKETSAGPLNKGA